MIRRAVAILDAAVGVVKRHRGNVEVGPGSRVTWHRLRMGRGNRFHVGEKTLFAGRVAFESTGGEVRLGDRCYVGDSLLVCHSSIRIGDDVIVSWGCTIVDHNSHSVSWAERRHDVSEWAEGRKDWTHVKHAAVTIEDRVWIGFGVSVLKGVRIGEGSVIGAGTVLTRSVPPYSVVGGNPGKVIRELAAHER